MKYLYDLMHLLLHSLGAQMGANKKAEFLEFVVKLGFFICCFGSSLDA